MERWILAASTLLAASAAAFAGAADVQTKTDHPWYPGELSCSTWERLFKTQAELYQRVTGRKCDSDEDKALASWFWRNVNYHHCTEGNEDIWDKGLEKGEANREYWAGLFGYGYGLCYTTHHQWHGEMAKLLGPCRARTMGVQGHTTFEVYLTGGEYGQGQWALLDHDVCTVVFTPDGKRLMGLMEISADMSSVKNSNLERGWRPGGLHPSDPDTYRQVNSAGYSTGYAGAPPLVNLRSGETLRRYLSPGLEDGKTFVYWGINYNTQGIPGPERSRTWVNQPEKLYQAKRDCGHIPGQGRFANAVYTYKPDFSSGAYKEALVEETPESVTLEFYSPYVIAATPPPEAAKEQWGIYKSGCTNGLVLTGKLTCPVEVSTDQGKTWKKAPASAEAMDLTDLVRGCHQYFLRLGASAKALADSGLTIRTVCQAAPTMIPRLKDGASKVSYESTGRAFISAGPDLAQVKAHLIEGKIDSPRIVLELAAPRKARAVHLYAACWAASGSPPAKSNYNIEYSTDGGKNWQAVLKDWQVIQRPPEPKDWWSQTLPSGDVALDGVAGPVRVRFTNTANRSYRWATADLVYDVQNSSPVKVTYAWKAGKSGPLQTASHTYPAGTKRDESWTIQTGNDVQTVWVEYAAE